MKKFIYNFTIQKLEDYFLSINDKKFRAKQLVQWLYEKNISSFDDISNLSKKTIEKLKEDFNLFSIIHKKSYPSNDGSTKIVYETFDNKFIETVVIPTEKRNTICISTQIGCPVGCSFCNTGTMGLVRNLSVAEVFEQVILSEQLLNIKITNVVYMGMGEPLANYDVTVESIKRLVSDTYKNMSRRKIVVSTSGLLEKMRDLALTDYAPKLALSLHFSSDNLRKKHIPVAKNYSLKELIDTCLYYKKETGLDITYEYLLIKNLNCNRENVGELVEIFKDYLGEVKFNLIPFNEYSGSDFQRPSNNEIDRFSKELRKVGFTSLLRDSAGRDVSGACGTLGKEFLE